MPSTKAAGAGSSVVCFSKDVKVPVKVRRTLSSVGTSSSNTDIIAHYHAARVRVTLAHAIQLERWSRGLSVMPEKTLGVTLVSKLRAILLMEADFNVTNKIIYGNRMMKHVRKHNQMPEEIFSKKNRMADNSTLCKMLFYDITRQARVPTAIASVDASNCYDRIAHAIASLVFQAFGVPSTAIETMLGAIENMMFFCVRDSVTQRPSQAAGSPSKHKDLPRGMEHHQRAGQ